MLGHIELIFNEHARYAHDTKKYNYGAETETVAVDDGPQPSRPRYNTAAGSKRKRQSSKRSSSSDQNMS
jgi:hypothetical protein